MSFGNDDNSKMEIKRERFTIKCFRRKLPVIWLPEGPDGPTFRRFNRWEMFKHYLFDYDWIEVMKHPIKFIKWKFSKEKI